MPELLLELFSEEIPAGMQKPAADNLERLLTGKLLDAGYMITGSKSFATPRRLTLVIDGLAEAQPDRKETRKGPRVGAPDKAIEGFLSSVGLTRGQVETQSGPKGDFYVAVIEEKGRPTKDVIADAVPEIIRAFPWPKSQRWGEGTLRWVRPLHSILCVFDGQTVDFAVGSIRSGNSTRGHRFLSPEPFAATNFEAYSDGLRAAHVILDRDERKEIIHGDGKQIAFAEGLEVKEDLGLLDEVAGLVEWPVVLMGRIDDEFMDVPPEVLKTAMKTHQKYFSLTDTKTAAMAPRFIVVSNMATTDHGAKIIDGNERVLRARLSDAKFFWDQDRKVKLETRVEKLTDMVFHARLGTVYDKVLRIEKLSRQLAEALDVDGDKAARAAMLCKADLMSEMVAEFPELQGLMGQYYAIGDGEDQAVGRAIVDHYAPQGPNDACPQSPVSVVVALADKIDTLSGFWAINEKPTGSKDPFALRRAALGVIRLILENKLRLKLLETFKWSGVQQSVDGSGGKRKVDDAEISDLLTFFSDRLKVHLRETGLRHDLIDAVFALGEQDDLVLAIDRVKALSAFVESEEGANLLALYRRAANILSKEEKKDKTSYNGKADAKLFEQEEERTLFALMEEVSQGVAKAVEVEDFTGAMSAMARLRAPADAFFDKVTVNAEQVDIRVNRLNLLSQIRSFMGSVADVSKIEG